MNIDQAFRIALKLSLDKKPRGEARKLANFVGVTFPYISQMKTGIRYGDEAIKRKVAEYFGYSYEEFLEMGGYKSVDTHHSSVTAIHDHQLQSRLNAAKIARLRDPEYDYYATIFFNTWVHGSDESIRFLKSGMTIIQNAIDEGKKVKRNKKDKLRGA